jgi:hypothetical protein
MAAITLSAARRQQELDAFAKVDQNGESDSESEWEEVGTPTNKSSAATQPVETPQVAPPSMVDCYSPVSAAFSRVMPVNVGKRKRGGRVLRVRLAAKVLEPYIRELLAAGVRRFSELNIVLKQPEQHLGVILTEGGWRIIKNRRGKFVTWRNSTAADDMPATLDQRQSALESVYDKLCKDFETGIAMMAMTDMPEDPQPAPKRVLLTAPPTRSEGMGMRGMSCAIVTTTTIAINFVTGDKFTPGPAEPISNSDDRLLKPLVVLDLSALQSTIQNDTVSMSDAAIAMERIADPRGALYPLPILPSGEKSVFDNARIRRAVLQLKEMTAEERKKHVRLDLQFQHTSMFPQGVQCGVIAFDLPWRSESEKQFKPYFSSDQKKKKKNRICCMLFLSKGSCNMLGARTTYEIYCGMMALMDLLRFTGYKVALRKRPIVGSIMGTMSFGEQLPTHKILAAFTKGNKSSGRAREMGVRKCNKILNDTGDSIRVLLCDVENRKKNTTNFNLFKRGTANTTGVKKFSTLCADIKRMVAIVRKYKKDEPPS